MLYGASSNQGMVLPGRKQARSWTHWTSSPLVCHQFLAEPAGAFGT